MCAEPRHRRIARRRFDRIAGGYESAARLDAEVGLRMLERLDYVRIAPQRVLDAGAGTGRDARVLARRYAGAAILALDSSIGMLRQARASRGLLARLRGRAPLEVCGGMEALPMARESLDLVWSNLALHWVDDPRDAFREFSRALRTDGLLMFSAYGPDTLRELDAAYRQVQRSSCVRRFVDMHDLGDMLVAAGFANPVMDMERITLTYADARGFFADLRATGQAVRPARPGAGLTGRASMAAIGAALDVQRAGGRLPITFEIVYGHAWKAARTRTAEGHAIMRTGFPKRLRR